MPKIALKVNEMESNGNCKRKTVWETGENKWHFLICTIQYSGDLKSDHSKS